MPELTEHVIDGAMFLRNCSREKAIEWLTAPITDADVEEFKRSDRLGMMLAQHLGFNEEEIRHSVARGRIWDAGVARELDGIRRSRIITAEDLAVTINTRDDD